MKKHHFCIRLFFYIIFLPLIIQACHYTYIIRIIPEDAYVRINGTKVENPCTLKTTGKSIHVQAGKEGYIHSDSIYSHNSYFSPAVVSFHLKKQMYDITLNTIPGNAVCSIDSGPAAPVPFKGALSYGEHLLSFRGTGSTYGEKYLKKQQLWLNRIKQHLKDYNWASTNVEEHLKTYNWASTNVEEGTNVSFPLYVYQPGEYLFRLQEKPLFMSQSGIYSCGAYPKQVNFTPDDRYLYITLLGGSGVQVFDVEKRKIIRKFRVGDWYAKCGFVEGLFIEKYRSYFVSQMTTARIFEFITKKDHPFYEYQSCEYPSELKRIIKTGGVWSKVIAYSDPLDLLAVSNWCSNNVSIIDYQSGRIERKLDGIKVPRGVAFSHDGKALYIASFEGGLILKYSTDTWKETARIYKKNGAMRHIRVSRDDRTLYVSNMYHFEVYEIDAASFSIVHTYKVYHNPNSIELSGNDELLFVSCRGPNNPVNYTRRSPENGKIMVFDLKRKELLTSFRGGNQPTGLDISNDGRLLAFSNFQDHTIEFYDISAMQKMLTLRDMNCLFPLNWFSFRSKNR
jgi:DNA-binding beta-propeller fold protein YncE